MTAYCIIVTAHMLALAKKADQAAQAHLEAVVDFCDEMEGDARAAAEMEGDAAAIAFYDAGKRAAEAQLARMQQS